MGQISDINEWQQIDLKVQNIQEADLDRIASVSGGYSKVFNRRARKFRAEGWHTMQLSETAYRDLILKEYTFLQRPVFVIDERVFVGNSKSTVEALKTYLASQS